MSGSASPEISELSGKRVSDKIELVPDLYPLDPTPGRMGLSVISANAGGNVSPEMFQPRVTPMRLFPAIPKPAEVLAHDIAGNGNLRSLDLFPQAAGFSPSIDNNDTDSRIEMAQMTIFYGGKVMVLDNFPADKAREVMLMAGLNSFGAKLAESQPAVPGHPTVDNRTMEEPLRRTPRRPNISVADFPISRKASLQKFLENRKDRISATAPYQIGGGPVAVPTKPVPDELWLGLAAQ